MAPSGRSSRSGLPDAFRIWVPGGWRIAHTGYRRTFEVSLSTKDLASFRLKRGTAYDG